MSAPRGAWSATTGRMPACRWMRARQAKTWFGRFVTGMHVVRSPKRLALVVITKLLGWAADLTAVMLVLHAVGIEVPVAAGMFILFAFNLAIAIPSTPGQIGALQVGGFDFAGVETSMSCARSGSAV